MPSRLGGLCAASPISRSRTRTSTGSSRPDGGHPLAFDLGQAVVSMMIAAADRGIGSCHSSVYDEELARSLLGYPGDRRCDYLVAFGYPADRPVKPLKSPKRRPFADLVHRHRW